MSLFSAIGSLYKESSDSIKDDNSAVSAEQNNPFISGAVLGARAAYDGIHDGFSYVIAGKKASLKQITKALDNWIKTLDKVVQMYKDALAKLDDVGADISGVCTLDFAKEAWEIIQDTPILRRYMGEANYWYLYDTLGLLATETGSLAADVLSGIKNALKQAILAMIATTDGLVSLESYMGYLQSAWGFLYVKCFWHVTLDSILPNVTTAYWYKPTHTTAVGTEHPLVLNNNPPGSGFVPIPLPVPNPTMVTRDASFITKFDYQNPDTWYLNGTPYYLPNTMNMLAQALNYWGSSYTGAYLPVVNNLYNRRDYIRDGVVQEHHPLMPMKTLAQLDTDKMSVSGSNVTSDKTATDLNSILDSVFTTNLVAVMKLWQAEYEQAYTILVDFILDGCTAYGLSSPTATDFWVCDQEASNTAYTKFKDWLSSADSSMFLSHIYNMINYWDQMLNVYATETKTEKNPIAFFDAVMNTLVKAGHASSGYDGSIDDNETFMVSPSFDPENSSVADSTMYTIGIGAAYIAYKVDTSSGVVHYIASLEEKTIENDSITATYTVSEPAFVMFPSNYTDTDKILAHSVLFNSVASTVLTSIANVSAGLAIGDSVDAGTLMEALFGGDTTRTSEALGELPDALCLHRSSVLASAKDIPNRDDWTYVGNMFFPDGKLPTSKNDAKPYATFYTIYNSYVETSTSASEELADIVGYSIYKGREPKFPCFGVYGNLICMASWNYQEMEYEKFISEYAKVKSGSKLYYKKADPSKIILYLDNYTSQSRNTKLAVYHEPVAQEKKSYGENDSYTYYVFPGESISVSKLPDGNFNLGSLLSVDATSPDGDNYHYIVIKNPTPHSAKYVDPTEWSFMDIVYELLLLARNLAGLCGDNGERLQTLEDDLKDFGLTVPEFIGELPENNGQYATFKFTILQEYADKIEKAVKSVYTFRQQLIAATEAW